MSGEAIFSVARLSYIILRARDRMEGNEDGDVDVETLVANVLASPSASDEDALISLLLDERVDVTGSFEDKVFKAAIANENFKSLCIVSPANARCVEEMLRRALPLMPQLELIWVGMAMTEAEAERILSIVLCECPQLRELTVFLGSCGDAIAAPLRKYLRQSTLLGILELKWGKFPLDETSDLLSFSQDSIKTICTGISESTSLQVVAVPETPTGDNASIALVADTLARAVSTSTSLKEVACDLNDQNFTEMFRRSLLRTESVQTFDLCFRWEEAAGWNILRLDRYAPWKPILSQDVPLAWWPGILAKTHAWTQYDSHRPLDALYFLIKEKNNVLLQNVHRRRIRKRKRFQMT